MSRLFDSSSECPHIFLALWIINWQKLYCFVNIWKYCSFSTIALCTDLYILAILFCEVYSCWRACLTETEQIFPQLISTKMEIGWYIFFASAFYQVSRSHNFPILCTFTEFWVNSLRALYCQIAFKTDIISKYC